jgi:hypothetical protein
MAISTTSSVGAPNGQRRTALIGDKGTRLLFLTCSQPRPTQPYQTHAAIILWVLALALFLFSILASRPPALGEMAFVRASPLAVSKS